jgi:hypothetical protein
MDLSKLSDSDLMALKAGDLTKVSDAGLMHLKGQSAPATAAAPAEPTIGARMKQQAGNAIAGAVRGAGSIGATILAPYDALMDKIDPQQNLSGLITGKQPMSRNDQRRADMDAALNSMGAETDSIAYQGGKLSGEIAGTAGAGGLIARGLSAIPKAAAVAPNFINAVRTSGMSAGTGGNALANLATRAAGGAVAGGASAGLVNPDDMATGAAVGGALPVALKAAGAAGNALGRVVRGPAQSADLAQAVQAARASGYVIPPTQAKPSLLNRALEGFSGKITTAQNASAKNQAVTADKVASALGLPADTKITPDVLSGVRKQAGQAYDALAQAGTIQPGAPYQKALDDIASPYIKAAAAFPNAKPSPVLDLVESLKSPAFDAGAAIEKIKMLRTAADDAFRTGNTDIGRASKGAAKALEDAIEEHLQAAGSADLLRQFKDARQLIAKTYTVEKALNPTTGSVDARNLAAQLKKGKPLSGELKDAAEFAARFPKAAQPVEGMGSLPQTSPLDWALGGTLSAASANPLMLASVLARPLARGATLSPMVQNRLVQGGPNALASLAMNPAAAQLVYRAAPVASGGR